MFLDSTSESLIVGCHEYRCESSISLAVTAVCGTQTIEPKATAPGATFTFEAPEGCLEATVTVNGKAVAAADLPLEMVLELNVEGERNGPGP